MIWIDPSQTTSAKSPKWLKPILLNSREPKLWTPGSFSSQEPRQAHSNPLPLFTCPNDCRYVRTNHQCGHPRIGGPTSHSSSPHVPTGEAPPVDPRVAALQSEGSDDDSGYLKLHWDHQWDVAALNCPEFEPSNTNSHETAAENLSSLTGWQICWK